MASLNPAASLPTAIDPVALSVPAPGYRAARP